MVEVATKSKEIMLMTSEISDKVSLISKVISLMLDSEVYLLDTLYHIKRNLIGGIMNGQGLILVRDGKIVAYCSWAFLSAEAEEKYIRDSNGLEVTDWVSGDRIWLVDVIAPYGDGTALMNRIRKFAVDRGLQGTKIRFKSYKNATDYDIREVKL